MNYILKIIFILVTIFIFSCKKNKTKIVTIKGSVLHTLSGLPLKGYTVYFTKQEDQQQTSINTVTDNNGNFIFENASISENSDYGYRLTVTNSIHTTAYPNSTPAESIVGIDETNIQTNYILKTSPWIDHLIVKLSTLSTIAYPDSISLDFKNEFYNNPSVTDNSHFKFTVNSNLLRNNNNSYLEQRPMGLWRINILKIKNGITTNATDSVFLNFDSQTTYTLNF